MGIEMFHTEPRRELDKPLIDIEKKQSQNYNYKVGNLLPLCCGHNGNLRPLEVEMYEYYLRNAKLF